MKNFYDYIIDYFIILMLIFNFVTLLSLSTYIQKIKIEYDCETLHFMVE